jgi:gliding motility-associated-like protein
VVGFSNPLCASASNGKVWISAGGTAGPYTYTFNGGSTPYQVTDTVQNLAAGSYTLTITDGKGCTKSDNVTLTNPSQLTVSPPAVTGISCANDANGIITVNATGGTRPYTYAWSPGSYTDSTESNLGPANYIITVTDANGCTASTSDSLSAPPLINDSLIIDSTSCPGSADGHIIVNANGGTPGNPITYTYSLDGTNYQQENNFFSLAAGVYQVYVKDSPGCVLHTTATIYQPSAITLSINPQDSLIDLGASIQLFSVIGNLTTQTVNSYSWSPSVGLSCLDCPNPVASPFQTTEYYLTVNYGKGCYVTDSNLIEIGKTAHVYIPNAFTPNGDGIDDIFQVFGTTLQSVAMTVFDRWGEKVFDSGDSQWATWDGTYRGVMQPPGIFVYYVTLVFLDGSTQVRQGSLTLIR